MISENSLTSYVCLNTYEWKCMHNAFLEISTVRRIRNCKKETPTNSEILLLYFLFTLAIIFKNHPTNDKPDQRAGRVAFNLTIRALLKPEPAS